MAKKNVKKTTPAKKVSAKKTAKPVIKAKTKTTDKFKSTAKPIAQTAKTAKSGKAAKPAKAVKSAAKPLSKSVKPVAKVKSLTQPKASAKTKTVTKPTGGKSVSPAAGGAKTSALHGKKSESYFQSFLTPLDDRIVVLVGETEKVTAGGLYIPDTVTDVSGNYHGKVMAIGRGHMNKKGKVKPLDVSLGDKVVFSQFSGSQIDVEGRNVMIIRESDVLGIVK
ncbi:MAG: co-chaperone GroES [Bdellovibrionaceae bacterium]|nr:co-chaperone GroES [Pseudobdellovibrionaceae bacterium]